MAIPPPMGAAAASAGPQCVWQKGFRYKKTLSPPLWIEAHGGTWDVDLGACGSRLTPPCSGVAPVRQLGGRTLLIPAEGITRHMRVWRLPSPTAEFSGRVGSRRRNKFRIVRFRINAKTYSLHCSSSPNRTRCAGLRFGLELTTGTIPILHPY